MLYISSLINELATLHTKALSLQICTRRTAHITASVRIILLITAILQYKVSKLIMESMQT